MSFQGDVAGIGLGELLQGLARGGRDGVLTLDGEGGFSCFLGLQGAQIHFLSGPAEDTDTWRERCSRAWADLPDPNLESKRRASIAHASRRETLYSMLEAPNLHVRFEPGAPGSASLARPDGLEAASGGGESGWGPGYSVEFLLLDHARIQDEAGSSLACDLSAGDMPRAMDASGQSDDARLFLEQCNGVSTLEEISDRLGWPVRQTRGVIGEHMKAGFVRISDHRELLVAGQRELELGRIGRAASRLERWADLAPPGPVFHEGEAELLVSEWNAERLILALNLMEAKRARAIMRRLDLISPEREVAVTRWKEFSQCRRRDGIIAFKCAILSATDELSTGSEGVAGDLLAIARSLQDKECPWRARPVLKLAASQLSDKMSMRLEVGGRMVQVGLVDDAAPIIIEAARELISNGEAEKAIPVLRALVNAAGDNREANGLLHQARAHKTTIRRKRRNTVVVLALVLVVSVTAFIRVHTQKEFDQKLTQVTDNIHQPETALALLDEYFPDDESPRVAALRLALEEHKSELAREARDKWTDAFEAIEQEVELGDPLLGLRRALELAAPPAIAGLGDWPTHQDLFGILARRLERTANTIALGIDATVEEQHAEDRVVSLLGEVLEMAESRTGVAGLEDFSFFVGGLRDGILEDQEHRADERLALETKQLEEQQDMMLAAARAHSQAGDLKRAVGMYDRLLALDASEALRPLLADEVDQVRQHYDALGRALERAHAGDHTGARDELEGFCPNLSEHQFPFRVESEPGGAHARFRESVRATPFVVYSRFGEELEIEFSMAGCETRTLEVDDPRDLLVHMFRIPERSWETGHRIEAAPVPVGGDHILADRSGRLVRLGPDGETKWSLELESLGGFARTPVFLPRRPGFVLVLSEDGLAWLVGVDNGTTEGPHDLGRPPLEGPIITRSGVSARFTDGRVALWKDDLVPTTFDNEGLFQSTQRASSGDNPTHSIAVLYRSAAAETSLASPWSDWKIVVEDDLFRAIGRGGESFTVRRDGDWSLVAWEAPNALVPDGRLWVSDTSGIRSFRPLEGPLTRGL